MPELPEVQTIVDDLQKTITHQKIIDFKSNWRKAIKKISFAKFKQTIVGQKILKIKRRGKNILLFLENDWIISIHLKMTGQLIYQKNFHKNKLLHHYFFLDKGFLGFYDARKFATLELMPLGELEQNFTKIGIDALSKKLNSKKLKEILEKNKLKNIKVVLLEQGLISGIGNIYASEILFDAKINPQKKSHSLKEREIFQLTHSIKKILTRAVKLRGTSISDYRDGQGKKGQFQNVLQVYGSNGQKCKTCGTIIEKIIVGQRSTFFCPKCQK